MDSDLDLFLRYCESRARLFDDFRELIGDAVDDVEDLPPHLVMDIFEFLYMISATGIDSGEKIGLLAEAHNAECERLAQLTPAALAKSDLNRTKVRDAMFSEKNIKKLRSNFALARAIDQSDMARFLFKHMSRETARKALILFDRAGLIQRIDAGDSVLIKLNGKAEAAFGRYLAMLMRPPTP